MTKVSQTYKSKRTQELGTPRKSQLQVAYDIFTILNVHVIDDPPMPNMATAVLWTAKREIDVRPTDRPWCARSAASCASIYRQIWNRENVQIITKRTSSFNTTDYKHAFCKKRVYKNRLRRCKYEAAVYYNRFNIQGTCQYISILT